MIEELVFYRRILKIVGDLLYVQVPARAPFPQPEATSTSLDASDFDHGQTL
ncbi:hypothetical protein [Methylothermus subterraneus]